MTICAWIKNYHLEYTCPWKEQAVGLSMIGCFWVDLGNICLLLVHLFFSSASSLGSRCLTFQKIYMRIKLETEKNVILFFPPDNWKKYYYLVSWQNTPINTSGDLTFSMGYENSYYCQYIMRFLKGKANILFLFVFWNIFKLLSLFTI